MVQSELIAAALTTDAEAKHRRYATPVVRLVDMLAVQNELIAAEGANQHQNPSQHQNPNR